MIGRGENHVTGHTDRHTLPFMDSNLKALKVIDLRAILSKASVPFPAKANKQDLIARIIASQQATQIYYQLHPDKYLSFFLSFCLVFLTFLLKDSHLLYAYFFTFINPFLPLGFRLSK